MIELLLSSRASDPAHCRECDGPREQGMSECADCQGLPLAERLMLRYQNGEGVTLMGAWGPVEVGREFNPLRWGLAIVAGDWWAGVQLGPWLFWARRVGER